MEHTSSDDFIREWEIEQERQKKAREAASAKEKLAEQKEQVKKKTHTPPQPTQPPQQPRPVQRQYPVQQQPIALLPWELAQPAPQEKKKEPISIYGPKLPKIPIPRGRGKGL